jgi:hypothetical protein
MRSFAEVRIILIIGLLVFFASCEKGTFNSGADARLFFSEDTLHFDTVFTATGSVTLQFKVRNENEENILLSSIRLMGGSSSPFSININGTAATEVTNLKMEGNDSIYVFVSVTVNPNTASIPFLLRDSIGVSWNGNTRFVQLEAYGQNARFLRNLTLHTDTVLNNVLPYVIIGPLVIDSGVTVQAEAGSRFYFHANASLQVRGSLQINGTNTQRVLFTGDRLDEFYRDLPGSWPGIDFSRSSRNNILKYCTVKNALNGLTCSGPGGSSDKILLQQCIIDNCSAAGILSDNSSLRAENCLISNCGANFKIKRGGQYQLIHCTLAAYSNLFMTHAEPVLFLSDAEDPGNSASATAPLTAGFVNCIFWGSDGFINNEIVTNKEGSLFSVTLDHCLFKAQIDPSFVTMNSVLKNLDPSFDSVDTEENYFDFRITNNPQAPGLDAGTNTSLLTDMDGKNRNVGAPDLGCYEKQ